MNRKQVFSIAKKLADLQHQIYRLGAMVDDEILEKTVGGADDPYAGIWQVEDQLIEEQGDLLDELVGLFYDDIQKQEPEEDTESRS